MKAKAIVFTGLVAALASLAAPLPLGAQNATGGNAAGQGTVGQYSPPPNLPPPPVDRASKLIGMKVKNPADQTLGTITDVVFDLQTGRISYVVLKKSGRSYGTGAYAAVPPNALAPSPDMKHLVLNTDKKKLQHSQGFSRNNYPPVGEPAYGAEPAEKQQQIIILPVMPSNPGEEQSPDSKHDQQQHQDQDSDHEQHTPDQDQAPHSTPGPE